MAKRSDFKRRKNDTYDTPTKAIDPLLPYLKMGTKFIEPAAGKGNIVDYLELKGHKCIGKYDIEPRRVDIEMMDAMKIPTEKFFDVDAVITNPPWQRPYPMFNMLEKFASIKPTWLLTDANWLFTKRGSFYVEKYCEKIICMPRVKWIENSSTTGKDDCVWGLYNINKNKPTQFIPRGVLID